MQKLINFSIIFILFVSMSSCSNDDTRMENEVSIKSKTDKEQLQLFQESVAISIVKNSLNKSESGKRAIELQLTDFSKLGILYPVYRFNGIEFCDTGRFNDKIAGDGIYTSVELVDLDNSKNEITESRYFVSNEFKYSNQLPQNNKLFDCAISHVECPNTSWYDNDWGTGWGCFEFSDCRVGF